MKKIFSILTVILLLSAIASQSIGAGAVEISDKNRLKQFKNTSAVKFKNSSDILNLPESYSSKQLGFCTSVKSQFGYICWDFASISSLETALLKNGLFSSDLSTTALDKWGSTRDNGEGWIRSTGDPGSTLIPIGYFMSRSGAVENTDSKVKNAVNAISYYDKGDNSLVKLAVMRTGAVTANFANENFAYSKNRQAYCLTNPIEGYDGHTVSVIGWDDNYSKDNFDGNYTPKNNGAWLCKNSWGPSYNAIGGYIWISYEDYYLFNNDIFDSSFAVENITEITDSEHLYQNEEFGATYSFSYINEKDITYFNVFDFSEYGNILNKVIFETTSLGAKYNVYYAPLDNNGAPVNDKTRWAKIKSGTVNYNGYICVDTENTIVPKEKAAIAVEINTDVAKYEVENNIGVSEWLREADTKTMRFMDTCESGESFITYNNSVVDVKDYYKNVLNDNIGGTLVIKAVTNGKLDTSVKGDVNYNEKVDINDASIIQKYLSKLENIDYNKQINADFNGDGKVNINDTTAIQKYLAGI